MSFGTSISCAPIKSHKMHLYALRYDAILWAFFLHYLRGYYVQCASAFKAGRAAGLKICAVNKARRALYGSPLFCVISLDLTGWLRYNTFGILIPGAHHTVAVASPFTRGAKISFFSLRVKTRGGGNGVHYIGWITDDPVFAYRSRRLSP